MRPHIKTKPGEALRKKAKQICPECGKDIHDPDCPYNENRGSC